MTYIPLNNAGGGRVLSFYIAGRLFGIKAADVAEVLDWRELTVIPNGPKFLLGIFPVRGEVVAAIDLRIQLGLTAVANSRNKFVVLHQRPGEIQFAFSTDSILGLTDLSDVELTADSPKPFISANAVLAGSPIEILDTPALVSSLNP